MVTRIKPSDEERANGAFDNETIEIASRCIRGEGALILEDVIDREIIREAKRAFDRKYTRHLNGQHHRDVLEVGKGRLMITVDLVPPFTRRELIANSWLLAVLNAAFDGDVVLGAYGVVCSLPGALRQHVHIDGGDLFAQAGLNCVLPIFAATVAIPLVEMNDEHGTTAIWPGSHREIDSPGATEREGGDEPVVREGSCMLWDYRTRHGGTPNQSTAMRPLIYMTYCRTWFTDHKNYHTNRALRAPEGFLKQQPEDMWRLLVCTEFAP